MMRGKSYMLHNSGLFDVVSKHSNVPNAGKNNNEQAPNNESGRALNPTAVC